MHDDTVQKPFSYMSQLFKRYHLSITYNATKIRKNSEKNHE